MSETWRLVGLPSLQRAIASQPSAVRAKLQDLIHATSFSIAQRIRASVPVETGALKESITTASGSGLTGGVTIRPGVIKGRRPEVYWRFVEFGTIHMSARPTIRPATEAEVPDVESRVTKLASDLERDLTSGGAI